MESFISLYNGFSVALLPINLLTAFIGCLLGTAIGVLPGIGPALTVALLLPVTVKLGADSALIMFCGILYGAMYGGSTTSILLNTPGESGSMMTALEGNKMAQRGRGAAALATAAIGSFVAGTIGTFLLAMIAPQLAHIAFLFGPEDYLALMILAFSTVSVVMGTSRVRGFSALLLGIGLGLAGIDNQTGQARLTFGSLEMLDGVQLSIVLVALFAIGETIYVATRYANGPKKINPISGGVSMTREDWKRSWKPWLRGTALGFPIGLLPAGGSEIPTFLSYFLEKKLAKKKSEFGKGAIEGVAGPEAANNATASGVLVPLLTLGLPTSATTAIMLVAFQGYGLEPGPFLFTKNPELVWGLIASLFVGNTMLLILNLPLAGVWVRLLMVPRPYLYAGIVAFAMVGIWGISNSWFDLLIMFAVGLIGYLMRVYDFPIAPVLIGMILGPMAETHLRRALAISQGEILPLFSTPISASLWFLAFLVLFLPILLEKFKRHDEQKEL